MIIFFGFLLLQTSPVALAASESSVVHASLPSISFQKRMQIRAAARRQKLLPAGTLPPSDSGAVLRSTNANKAQLAQLGLEIVRLVNIERAKVGLSPLTINAKLEQAALGHAKDMVARNYFDHNEPNGRTPEMRIEATGYLRAPCDCTWISAVGENIATGYVTAQSVMEAWMASPEHRANILRPHYREIGVGIVGTMWVQEFGAVYPQ